MHASDHKTCARKEQKDEKKIIEKIQILFLYSFLLFFYLEKSFFKKMYSVCCAVFSWNGVKNLLKKNKCLLLLFLFFFFSYVFYVCYNIVKCFVIEIFKENLKEIYLCHKQKRCKKKKVKTWIKKFLIKNFH